VYGFVGPLYPALLALVTPFARGAFPAALVLSWVASLATLIGAELSVAGPPRASSVRPTAAGT
jgi:hypothetical protein